MQPIWRFLQCEEGPTAVEYAVMLAMILLAVAATVLIMAQAVGDSFNHSGNQIDKAFNPSP